MHIDPGADPFRLWDEDNCCDASSRHKYMNSCSDAAKVVNRNIASDFICFPDGRVSSHHHPARLHLRHSSCGREFIKRGYGVIYLGRTGCAAPFARRIQDLISSHVDLNFMDKLVLGGELLS